MSVITLSDGQPVRSEDIRLVRLHKNPDRLVVDLVNGESIIVRAADVHADADLLDDVRDREKLNYLVSRDQP